MPDSLPSTGHSLAGLYANHHGWLVNWLRGRLQCSQQTADLAQDTFVRVLLADRSQPLLSELREPRHFLVTMARRRAIDRVRSSQSSRERESRWRDYMPDVDQTVQQVEDRLVGEQVHRALEAVGEPYRSTIELAYFTGLTHREIARRTGTPLGTVKTRIRDGMARLRRELGVQS